VLCELLLDRALLPVIDIDDKLRIVPGRIHLAPPDYHLLVERDRFALSTDSPADERPSIDVLFDSAVDAYREAVIGVLVGDRSDGGHGFARIGEAGGLMLVQPRGAELLAAVASAGAPSAWEEAR
jgi:two-component system, chemotaxis family, protein-glutamate methylesterase/glutaminase